MQNKGNIPTIIFHGLRNTHFPSTAIHDPVAFEVISIIHL